MTFIYMKYLYGCILYFSVRLVRTYFFRRNIFLTISQVTILICYEILYFNSKSSLITGKTTDKEKSC